MSSNGEHLPRYLPECDLASAIVGFLSLPERVSKLEGSIEEMRSGLDAEDDGLATLRNSALAIDTKLDRAVSGIEGVCEQFESIHAAFEQRNQLTERFLEEGVLEPLARRLFQLIDLLGNGEAPDPRGGPGQPILDVLTAIRAELFSLLLGYGIEPVSSEAGSRLDARLMRPIRTKHTTDPQLDLTVAETLRIGFRRGDRILRPQGVVIFRWAHPGNRIDAGGGQ